MCNIAGYAGSRQAAPILLEMLRAQQDFDGGLSTGIATIHEGKLYYRKMVGSVDDIIKNSDVLDLPGTIGIAHSRPGGLMGLIKPDFSAKATAVVTPSGPKPYGQNRFDSNHPSLNVEETLALVTNGGHPPFSPYGDTWDEAFRELSENGYIFETAIDNPEGKHPNYNGKCVHVGELRVNLTDSYIKQGLPVSKALANTCTRMFTDNVSVILSEAEPDKVFACRACRPMSAVMANGETYIASTRHAFPVEGEVFSLPLMHVCEITRDGVKITADRIQRDHVCEVTPYAYHEAYERIVNELRGKKDAPLYFDDLEFFMAREALDIWPEQHILTQGPRVVYDVIWQLQQEGRLKTTIKPLDTRYGPVDRIYMWLED